MVTPNAFAQAEYKYGFVTDIEEETAPRGLTEDTIRWISAKKQEPEFMLEWRLRAFRHFLTLLEKEQSPKWANVHYPAINFADGVYYAAPKKDQPTSLEDVDKELLATYEKLGIPLQEQKRLAGVAVDAVFDSVSVATTFKGDPRQAGHHLRVVQRGRAESPGACEEVPGLRCSLYRQLLRRPQLRRLL